MPEDGIHRAAGPALVRPERITEEQWKRIRALENRLMCACPAERWTRTLTQCSDACANPQKLELQDAVLSGRSDDEISGSMEARHGPQVLAVPGWEGTGKWTYLLPILILAGAAAAAAGVLVRWAKRPPAAERDAAGGVAGEVAPEEVARVEEELRSLE